MSGLQSLLSVVPINAQSLSIETSFEAAGTLWFVIGSLTLAGDEDDGMAAETEIAGTSSLGEVIEGVHVVFEWAAATFPGKHAVVKTGDMLEFTYDNVKSAIDNEWSFVAHSSRDCGCHCEGRCCSPSFAQDELDTLFYVTCFCG